MPRSIRPKPSGPSTIDDHEEPPVQHHQRTLTSPDSAPPKLKRQQTHIACNSCRLARAKCDGKRPCGRCVVRTIANCSYEVHEGETRMSSLRKKVMVLEEEVNFLRDLIDTGWDTSQDQLRLRVRQGPSPGNDDTPRTLESVTTASDVNTPEDGGDFGANIKKRRAGSIDHAATAQQWVEDVSKNDAESASTNEERFRRSHLETQGAAHHNLTPYNPRHHDRIPSRLLSSPFDRSSHYDRSSTSAQPPPPPADLLPQPFFEQLCALLDTGQTLPSLASVFAERLDDHITILAVTRGWAEVIRTVALDPQWQVLRQIDGYLSFMRPVDRLATLRFIRLVMKCSAATGVTEIEDLQNLLPDWAKPTPIQGARRHPNIIQYIPWPPMRNYLMTHPALISAPFFSSYLSGLRFNFPGEINPVVSTPMGMLELVPEFERSLRDLNSWTITQQFVDRYPVFDPAVPVFEQQARAMESRVDGLTDGVEEFDEDPHG